MSGMYLDPTTSSEAFDGLIINGTLKTPGKCKATGWDRPVEYDHKLGKGTKGAEQTLKGLPPAKGSFEFETWTPEQRQAWTPILDALKFDPTKLATATPTTATAKAATPDPGAVPKPTGVTWAQAQAQGFSSISEANAAQATSAAENTSALNSVNAEAGGTAKNNQPSPLSSAFAIEVFYPTLADIDVHFVLPPEKIGAWEPVGDDFSHMKRTIEFVEFTGTPPSKSIASTPSGATATPAASPGAATAAGTPAEPSAATSAASNQSAAGSGAQGAWGAS